MAGPFTRSVLAMAVFTAATGAATRADQVTYEFTFSGMVTVVDALALTPLGETVDLMPDVVAGAPLIGFGVFSGDLLPGGLLFITDGLIGISSPGSSLGFTAPIFQDLIDIHQIGLTGGPIDPIPAHNAYPPSLGEFDYLNSYSVSLYPDGLIRISLHHSSLQVRNELGVEGRVTTVTIVPEPTSRLLLGAGLAVFGAAAVLGPRRVRRLRGAPAGDVDG